MFFQSKYKFSRTCPLNEYCKTKGVEFKNGEKETHKALRANLALQLFGENTFNQIINQGDIFIEKAIKTLDTL